MNVLIGCEYSGIVRDAFLAKGHNAWSCDLLPSDADPVRHRQEDVLDVIRGTGPWHLIIIHPPCTYLTVAGNRHYGKGKPQHDKRLEAAKWTQELWDHCMVNSPRVCLENPVGVLPSMTNLPKPDYVHPWQFGHPEQKKTGLFLHNLPPLVETDNVYDHMMTLTPQERERVFRMAPSPDRWKLRSTTYKGIAAAMADQWGDL